MAFATPPASTATTRLLGRSEVIHMPRRGKSLGVPEGCRPIS